MTRAELRLELIRIVHHNSRDDRQTLEIVQRYEASFAGLTVEEGGAQTPPPPAPPAPKPKNK